MGTTIYLLKNKWIETYSSIKLQLMKKIIFPILIILMLFGLMTSCKKTNKGLTENTFSSVEYTEIGQGNLSGEGEDTIAPQNMIISDAYSWNELMSKMDSNYSVTGSFTETIIDFSKFTVIAVFDQIYGDSGHSIDITEIIEDETHTYIKVKSTMAGEGLTITTQPFHIVKITKNDKQILFE